MADDKPAIAPALVLSAIVAVLSVLGTLLIHNMRSVESKADKSELVRQASDRYTGREATLEKECGREKEILRAQRETLRAEVNDVQIKALRWEGKFNDCENRWLMHLRTCKCGGMTPINQEEH